MRLQVFSDIFHALDRHRKSDVDILGIQPLWQDRSPLSRSSSMTCTWLNSTEQIVVVIKVLIRHYGSCIPAFL